MGTSLTLSIPSWKDGAAIPDRHAFGKPGKDQPFAPGDNINPAINWRNAPAGTQSFTLICHDSDVPSRPDDVNQFNREVPADLQRVPFFHWVLIDIPMTVTSIDEGAVSNGIVAKGKAPVSTELGRTGLNNYTEWFATDPDMAGTYAGYDGPCPPWNDSIIHHYHFHIYALDRSTLDVPEVFGGPDVLTAMEGHILEESVYTGTYAMNPRLRAAS